jgi:RTA1 like protein
MLTRCFRLISLSRYVLPASCRKELISPSSARYCRFKPFEYTIVFVTGDVISLVIQAAGGAMAATAKTNTASNEGAQVMVGSVMWQMGASAARYFSYYWVARGVVMAAYTAVLVEFIVRFMVDAPVSRHFHLFNRCHRNRRAGDGTLADNDKQDTDVAEITANNAAINLLLIACALSTLLIFIRWASTCLPPFL